MKQSAGEVLFELKFCKVKTVLNRTKIHIKAAVRYENQDVCQQRQNDHLKLKVKFGPLINV